jgi:hypothetical protein
LQHSKKEGKLIKICPITEFENNLTKFKITELRLLKGLYLLIDGFLKG